MKLNTVGASDGILEGWIDDQLVFSRKNLRFRTVSSLKIEKVWATSTWAAAGPPRRTWRFTWTTWSSRETESSRWGLYFYGSGGADESSHHQVRGFTSIAFASAAVPGHPGPPLFFSSAPPERLTPEGGARLVDGSTGRVRSAPHTHGEDVIVPGRAKGLRRRDPDHTHGRAGGGWGSDG